MAVGDELGFDGPPPVRASGIQKRCEHLPVHILGHTARTTRPRCRSGYVSIWTYCLNVKSEEERVVLQKAELNGNVDSENNHGGSSSNMYYIGLDVHKKTISYCVKD